VLSQKGETDKDRIADVFPFPCMIMMFAYEVELWSDVRCSRLWMLDEQRANKMLLVLEPNVVVFEPQWRKITERAKRLLIPPVYFLRGSCAYDELQIVNSEVGRAKQTVTVGTSEVCQWRMHFVSEICLIVWNRTASVAFCGGVLNLLAPELLFFLNFSTPCI